MDEQLTLFDAPPATPRRPGPRPHPEQVVEPLAPGYTYLRDNRGVLPFAHLIGAWGYNGVSITLCQQAGTKISNAGVETMIRCPSCDLAQQML